MSEISQETLDEAAIPELSEDFFTLEGRRVQIKPLKIKYQKQFAKAFTPILENVAIELGQNAQMMQTDDAGKTSWVNKGFADLSVADALLIGKALLDSVDTLPRLMQILAHNDGFLITDDDLDESTMQAAEMQAVVIQFLRKSGDVQAKIADFFDTALPRVKAGALDLLAGLTTTTSIAS